MLAFFFFFFVFLTLHFLFFFAQSAFFSSNFPVDKLAGSYDNLYNAFKIIVKDFSAADKQKLFKTNVERIYRV